MANQQLVDYIKSQLQLGVAKEAVRSTLLQAGWGEGDMSEALNAATPAAPAAVSAPAATTSPVSQNPPREVRPTTPVSSPLLTRDIFQSKSLPGQGEPFFQPKPAEQVFQPKKEALSPAQKNGPVVAVTPTTPRKQSSGKGTVFRIVGIVLVTASLGAVGFFYKQVADLQGKLNELSSGGAGASSQIATLTQERDKLVAEVAALKNENTQLVAELAIFAGQPTATSTAPITAKGVLSGGGKAQYALTTKSGVVAYVKNSKDMKVDAALKPFVGTEIEISGTHVTASRDVTVTAVNGKLIE